MRRQAAMALLSGLIAGACTGSSPGAPSPTSPAAGIWTGTVTGAGTTRAVRLTLVATSATGDTSLAAGRYDSATAGGVISGEAGAIVVGTRVSLLLTPAPPRPCDVTQPFPADQMLLQLTLDGTRMSGDGAVTFCGGSEPAQATFTKP